MPDETAAPARVCAVCHRHHLVGRLACRGCQAGIDTHLAAMPDLFQAVTAASAPGAPTHGTHHTSATATPGRLAALNWIGPGGAPSILRLWHEDWHLTLGWGHPAWAGSPEQTLITAASWLRTQLPWAVEHHPAIGDVAAEVHALYTEARTITGAAERLRYVGDCPTLTDGGRVCGRPLIADIGDGVILCRGCRTRRTRNEWLHLGQLLRNTHPASPATRAATTSPGQLPGRDPRTGLIPQPPAEEPAVSGILSGLVTPTP